MTGSIDPGAGEDEGAPWGTPLSIGAIFDKHSIDLAPSDGRSLTDAVFDRLSLGKTSLRNLSFDGARVPRRCRPRLWLATSLEGNTVLG